ncbi:MAG TPA: nitrilase-related carbon-nitrogen hydrolase [Candidatus Binataceae bacterium]|nr:nitrilase-related carbon-nitrogen hydrolase [Candidatus Binataceae bacterium]
MPRLGVAQFTGSINWEENIAAVSRLAAGAAEAGVQMLGFHELASTIYPPYVENPDLMKLAEPDDGPSVSAASSIARQNELVMVYPFYERDGDRLYNSAIIFGPRGERLGKYRKTSVPASRLLPGASERYYFSAGDLGFPVVETPWGVRIGVIICYDRNLPEPARCVAMNGADVLFVPVTTVHLVRPWWELLLRARAVENVMYVAAPSRIGEDRGGAPGVFYFGESLIIDPTGEVVGHASEQREDLVSVELDLDLLRRQRKTWQFFEDRRPELYGCLTDSDRLPRFGRAATSKG